MKNLFYLFLLLSTLSAKSQISMSGSITSHVNNLIDNLPGSGGLEYSNPSPAEYSSWETLITNFISGANVSTSAASFEYDFIEFIDSSRQYFILQPSAGGSRHWGIYVFNYSYCRELVIQAPHPKYDFNTAKEAIYVMKKSRALLCAIAGTHRCNHTLNSGCSGTTSVCGGTGLPFKISDLAHNDSSAFQATTASIFNLYPTTTFLQLHGFTKGPTDPYVILSNGTRDLPFNDNIDALKTSLAMIDPVLDFKVAHVDLTWNRLIGFTNTQGRFINSSGNPCSTSAIASSGKFIHMEQEKTRLRDDSTKWEVVSQAINNSFPCLTSVFQMVPAAKLYPNPAQHMVRVETTSIILEYKIYSMIGQLMHTQSVNSDSFTVDVSSLPTGVYSINLKSGKSETINSTLVVE